MKELGEDPAEYEKLRQSLLETLQPQDSFEEMLVEDMAQLPWRLKRLKRAEAGILVCQRRKLEIDRESRLCREGRKGTLSPEARFDPLNPPCLIDLPDGTHKFRALLEALRSLEESVRTEGFDEPQIDLLEQVYGEHRSYTGEKLTELSGWRPCSEEGPEGAEHRGDRDGFLTKLHEEIKSLERLAQLYWESEVEATQPMLEAQLLPHGEDLDKILRYETALERQFREKLQLLVAWRRARGESVPVEESERQRG